MFKEVTYNPSQSVLGVNNGIYQLVFPVEYLKKNSNFDEIEKLIIKTNINDFIKHQNSIYKLNIRYLKGVLLKNANLTDILVFSPFFFGYQYVVSQNFVDCLFEVGVSNNEYHLRKIEIENINVNINYYLFFVPFVPNTEIDFSNSILYPEEDLLSRNKRYYTFNSYQEFLQYSNNNLFYRWKKICLDKKYRNRDIIKLQINNKLFFSKRLIKKLQEKKITNLVVKNENILFVGDCNLNNP